jgi:hypothetical protein
MAPLSVIDDSSDDNRDDSFVLNYADNTPIRLLKALFKPSARSWQCRGRGYESASTTTHSGIAGDRARGNAIR